MCGVGGRRVAVRDQPGLQLRGGGAAVHGRGRARLVRGAHGEGAQRGPRALRHRAPLAQLAQGKFPTFCYDILDFTDFIFSLLSNRLEYYS